MQVLIVDDEKLALSRLQRLLKDQNIIQVTACDNPNDAILEVSKQNFDVAFLDISMPQMSGLELAQRLNNIAPDMFLVFQIAHDEFALDAYNCGSIDYLIKPIEASHITRVLQRIKKYQNEHLPQNSSKLMGKRGNRLYIISKRIWMK